MEPYFGGRGGHRGSGRTPLERVMVISCRLPIVTVALSVTIRPQFAIECLRRSNQRGVSLWAQILGPLEQTRHVGVAKSEHPRLTNGEIIFEEFQPIITYVITIHQRYRQTDRQTTCDRNTALCTKVHRAVKLSTQCTLAIRVLLPARRPTVRHGRTGSYVPALTNFPSGIPASHS